jgi:hypothetical protein
MKNAKLSRYAILIIIASRLNFFLTHLPVKALDWGIEMATWEL